MRYLVIIFLIGCVALACVKPKTKDPVPVIEFKGVHGIDGSFWPTGSVVPKSLTRLPASGILPERDTASFIIGYQDGDGDLFRNSTTDGNNIIYTVHYFNTDSNKMSIDGSFGKTILQPADGYYKGKSVQGEIEFPLSEMRSTTAHKILKFEVFMQDMKSHISNTVTSATYTLEY